MKSSSLFERAGPCRFALYTGVLALLSLSSPSVLAYSYTTCEGTPLKWNNNRAKMYISTTSFVAGSEADSRLQNAMWHWNNVKGSSFKFYVGRDTDGKHSDSNGVNEVYFSSADTGSALAVTITRYKCYWLFGWHKGITDADIAFNTSLSWATGLYDHSNPGGAPFNFEGVALHEFGHALGLDHEDRSMATLNSFYPNSGPLGHNKEWDPLADDRQGARFLYPDGTTETDIGASPLKRTGMGSSNLVSSPGSAALGSTINVEFSFSNQSTSLASFDIGFYLSTNDYISTFDVLLGTNSGAQGSSGFTGTFTRSLDIPSWIAPGTYYLGFIMDPGNAVAEANESNGFQEIPRTIVIN